MRPLTFWALPPAREVFEDRMDGAYGLGPITATTDSFRPATAAPWRAAHYAGEPKYPDDPAYRPDPRSTQPHGPPGWYAWADTGPAWRRLRARGVPTVPDSTYWGNWIRVPRLSQRHTPPATQHRGSIHQAHLPITSLWEYSENPLFPEDRPAVRETISSRGPFGRCRLSRCVSANAGAANHFRP